MNATAGQRIFLVEDEYILARQISRALSKEGAEVVGCVGTVAAALDELSRIAEVDLAILDINLAGEKVYPVAVELERRGVGFVFLSGYDMQDRDARFASAPQLSKPITMPALTRVLQAALLDKPSRC